jgi:hypothetical protein
MSGRQIEKREPLPAVCTGKRRRHALQLPAGRRAAAIRTAEMLRPSIRQGVDPGFRPSSAASLSSADYVSNRQARGVRKLEVIAYLVTASPTRRLELSPVRPDFLPALGAQRGVRSVSVAVPISLPGHNQILELK